MIPIVIPIVKLTSVYDGSPVYVNAANVAAIETYSEGCTKIHTVGDGFVKVTESAESVVELICGDDDL